VGGNLLSSINIGRETLISHGSAMAAMSDNVSNSNTTGFKAGAPRFSDMLARGEGARGDLMLANYGNGSTMEVRYVFAQGGVEPTGRPYDFAIEGEGFFTVAKPGAGGIASTEVYYTRAGNFSLDPGGRLINPQGYFVMGFVGDDAANLQPLITTGNAVPATASTLGRINGNLSAETPIIAGAVPEQFASMNELTALQPFAVPFRVVDSLGSAHEVTINFFKTGVGQWTARAYVDGAEVAGGTAGVPAAVGPATVLQFGEDGRPTVANALLNIQANWANGAAASAVEVDISEFTGFASPSAVYGTVQNGILPGIVTGLSIDDKGVVSELLSNGERNIIGRVALARFPSVDGLKRVGNAMFQATPEAGEVIYEAPQEEGRGAIRQGFLENSNVDLADQFVSVIKVQRSYQAGSQVIKTADGLLETTIGLA
jgi:flagellar hook protein FlgE